MAYNIAFAKAWLMYYLSTINHFSTIKQKGSCRSTEYHAFANALDVSSND
jgi:hypothetical protein